MPAYLGRSGLMGYKSFHGSLKEGVRYLIVLIDNASGEILALVDAAYLTALRTGATSGVATRYLSSDGAVDVGVIGSGLEAETNLAGVAAVRPVRRARVFSRSPERRKAFAERSSRTLDAEVVPVTTPQQAVAGADVVIVATNTGMNGPVAYEGAWMEPGQYVVSIGATSPFLHELDAESFTRPTHVVFDAAPSQVFEESGDLLALSDEERRRLRGAMLLPAVVAGERAPLRSPNDITLFKSVGTAAQDLAAAKAIFDVAVERGMGRNVGVIAAAKQF
jgi:alanine dehydrogenase